MSLEPVQSPTPPPADPSTTIETLPPRSPADLRLAPLSPRTGEPVRPWTVWASATTLILAATTVAVALGQAMWELASPFVLVGDTYVKQDRFQRATWLTSLWLTEPGSGWRVLLAVSVTLIAVTVVATVSILAFYAFRGYRWTRTGSLVGVGITLLTLTLNQLAWIAIPLVLLGACPLWLAPTERFFARWTMLRHPDPLFSEPVDGVFYGPLPRFR